MHVIHVWVEQAVKRRHQTARTQSHTRRFLSSVCQINFVLHTTLNVDVQTETIHTNTQIHVFILCARYSLHHITLNFILFASSLVSIFHLNVILFDVLCAHQLCYSNVTFQFIFRNIAISIILIWYEQTRNNQTKGTLREHTRLHWNI